jgi:hypothetical protein
MRKKIKGGLVSRGSYKPQPIKIAAATTAAPKKLSRARRLWNWTKNTTGDAVEGVVTNPHIQQFAMNMLMNAFKNKFGNKIPQPTKVPLLLKGGRRKAPIKKKKKKRK